MLLGQVGSKSGLDVKLNTWWYFPDVAIGPYWECEDAPWQSLSKKQATWPWEGRELSMQGQLPKRLMNVAGSVGQGY